LLASLLAPPLARAEPSASDKAEADSLFREGKKLMDLKRYSEACRKLEGSQKLEPAPGTLLNLAVCHEAEGKLATAWVEFNDALVQAKAEKNQKRIQLAKERIAVIEPRLPKLTIVAPHPTPGQSVRRDDSVVLDAALGTAVPVDPGEHTVSVSAPGFRSFDGHIKVGPGATEIFTIPSLEPQAPVSASSGSTSASAPPPPPEDTSGRRTAGYVVGGVGVVALVVGGVFGLRTFSKKKQSDDACVNGCSADGVSLNKDAYRAATIANVGVGVGLAGVGVGLFLILTSRSSPAATSDAQPAVSLAPVLGPGAQGLLLTGRFLPLRGRERGDQDRAGPIVTGSGRGWTGWGWCFHGPMQEWAGGCGEGGVAR
jgi:hypothetical protein